ncbi:MAG: response regulator transcription factor [Acidobacteriota bacterium]
MAQMKVLIVDDSQQIRLLLRSFLPLSVDEVFECGDGGKAVALYRKHLPDWVLMDWQMPHKDGIAAIREILAEFPRANICMVTAFNEEELRDAAFAAGASGFVTKSNLFEMETILVDELKP